MKTKTKKNKGSIDNDKMFIVCWKDHTANASWVDDISTEKYTTLLRTKKNKKIMYFFSRKLIFSCILG